jgi:hypothetical protein
MAIDPLNPELEVPVFRSIDPLLPDNPEFTVDRMIEPLVVDELKPLVNSNEPPLRVEVSPAERIRFPPAPLSPEPTPISIIPPLPDTAEPVPI